MAQMFKKNPRTFILLAVALMATLFLLSCGTAGPKGTAVPTVSPTATKIDVPGSATPIPELTTAEAQATEDGKSGILLPTVTPAPTSTPGVISQMVDRFAESRGLHQTTVVGINVDDLLNLLVSIFIALVVGLLLSRLVYFVLERTVAQTESKYDDAFIKVIRHQVTLIFTVIGLQFGTLRLNFIDVANKQLLNRLYIATYIVAGTIILWRLLDILVEWYHNEIEPQHNEHQLDTLLILLQRFAHGMLIITSALMLLSLYNINVTALVAALGVGGLAISLAAQDTLSNVIAGIMIMFDQPFRVGDRIEIQGLGTWGDVVDIGLRSTRIRTRDNRMVIVPNNSISTDQIVNYSYPDPQYRIQIEIGIGYGQDIEKVRKIIVDTVSQVEGVLQDRPVDALYVEMGASAMTFRVRWWIDSYVDTRRMFDRVNTVLQTALNNAGIECPFNTIDVNIRNMPGVADIGDQTDDADHRDQADQQTG